MFKDALLYNHILEQITFIILKTSSTQATIGRQEAGVNLPPYPRPNKYIFHDLL